MQFSQYPGFSHSGILRHRRQTSIVGPIVRMIFSARSDEETHAAKREFDFDTMDLRAKLSLIVYCVVFCFSRYSAARSTAFKNDYPIILVHGFGGFDTLLGMKYWGGFHGSVQKDLEEKGHRVISVSIGPISSNWDRACEIFAQLKGGRVDYGEEHAAVHKHKRYGRVYDGLYPEWGTRDANGNIRKVHFIGHSMGGQTIRMLSHILLHGAAGAPVSVRTQSNGTEMFSPHVKDWVHSITTLSTPHEGTHLANGLSFMSEILKKTVGSVIALYHALGGHSRDFFDCKLDQWGLQPKQKGESIHGYFKRIVSSHIFEPGFKDISLWDLSTEGAMELNEWVKADPRIFYFSYSTQDTFKAVWNIDSRFYPVHYPRPLSMFAPFHMLSLFIGGIYSLDEGFGTTWQPNDGVVNTCSMKGSALDEIVEFDGIAKPGKWQHMGLLQNVDHVAVTGFSLFNKVSYFYRSHANFLRDLPLVPEGNKSQQQILAQAEGFTTSHDVKIHLYDAVKQLEVESLQSAQDLDCSSFVLSTPPHNFCLWLRSQSIRTKEL